MCACKTMPGDYHCGQAHPDRRRLRQQQFVRFYFPGFDSKFTVTGQLNVGTSVDAVGGYDVTGITGCVAGPGGGVPLA